jgi:hypothetical protein
MKTVLINQPGRTGDIIICLPIAEWYHNLGMKVDWLCPKQYHPVFRNIDYCTPIEEVKQDYNQTLDLSFGLVKNTTVDKWWEATKHGWRSFVNAKYHLAEVPVKRRWNLSWNRNLEREDLLLQKIKASVGKDFAVVQDKTHNFKSCIVVKNKVEFYPVEDYNIFDWFGVLTAAKEIHCIDSCLCNFVDVLPAMTKTPKFYYSARWGKTNVLNSVLINNWVMR